MIHGHHGEVSPGTPAVRLETLVRRAKLYRNVRLVRGVARLSLPGILALAGFVLALFAISLSPGDQRVWARVTGADNRSPGYFIADFHFEGEPYELSIDGRGRLAPGDTVRLHFFLFPHNADWLSHRGGHGPYTWGGILVAAIVFFAVMGPTLIFANRYLSLRQAQLKDDGRRIGRIFRFLWNRYTAPAARPFLTVILAVLVVLLIGFVGQSLFGASPRDTPEAAARAYLRAMVLAEPNDACDLIAPEERYRFLTTFPQWRLESFELAGPPERRGKWSYHSANLHASIGEGDDLWVVRYQYRASTSGRTDQGAAELVLVYQGAGFFIQSGYLPLTLN